MKNMEKDLNEMNEQQSQPNPEDMANNQNDVSGNESNNSTFYNETQYDQGYQSQDMNNNQTYYNNGYNDTYQNNETYNQYGNGPYDNNSYDNGAYNNGNFQNSQFEGTPDGNKNNKKSHKVLKLCGIAALGIVVGVGAFATLTVIDRLNSNQNITMESGQDSQAQNEDSQDTGSSSSNVTIGSTETVGNANDKSGVSAVVESALPSIVMINCNVTTTQYGQQAQGVASGSGIIVKEDDNYLYIVTNYHVVSDANSISVVFDDEKSVDASLKAYDSTNDLAVLKIKSKDIKDSTKKAIKIATLGSSDDLKVGAMAIAIGNALGYGQSVTVGYVSAKDRAVTIDSSTRVLLQTDAAINPGNSGGALLDINGKVIGINSAKYSSTDVEGVCYAIPISKAIPIINDLMTKDALSEEEKGYLGITGSDVDETVHSYYNVPLGVRVTEVTNKGAADEAGIKENDIITGVNGIEVTSISALKERVNSYKVGTEVTITLERQTDGAYKKMEVKVKLQKGSTTTSSDNNSDSQSGSSGSNGSDGGNYYYFGNGSGSDGSSGSNGGWPFSFN